MPACVKKICPSTDSRTCVREERGRPLPLSKNRPAKAANTAHHSAKKPARRRTRSRKRASAFERRHLTGPQHDFVHCRPGAPCASRHRPFSRRPNRREESNFTSLHPSNLTANLDLADVARYPCRLHLTRPAQGCNDCQGELSEHRPPPASRCLGLSHRSGGTAEP